MYRLQQPLNNRYICTTFTHQMYNLSDVDICVKYGKTLGLCEIVFIQRMSRSAGYKLLIEISEWHALYGMFSEKLSISCNESAKFSREILIIYWYGMKIFTRLGFCLCVGGENNYFFINLQRLHLVPGSKC